MNNTNVYSFFNTGVLPIFLIISLVIGIVLVVVGLILSGRRKGGSKAGWICVGIGAVSVITNALQLFMRL